MKNILVLNDALLAAFMGCGVVDAADTYSLKDVNDFSNLANTGTIISYN